MTSEPTIRKNSSSLPRVLDRSSILGQDDSHVNDVFPVDVFRREAGITDGDFSRR